MAPLKAKHLISLGHSKVDLTSSFQIIRDNYPKVFLRVDPLELLMVEGVGLCFRVIDGTSHFPGLNLIRQFNNNNKRLYYHIYALKKIYIILR